MPGSRKGERRGAADPNHIRKTAAPPRLGNPKFKKGMAKVAGSGRKKGSLNKKPPPEGWAVPELVALINRRSVGPEKMQRDVEMYFLITGKRERMPREVLLSAMRYFEETAIDYAGVLRANLQAEAAAETAEARRVLGAAVADAEGRVDKYVAMAADVAMKAAPYLHPKLAALITAPGNDKSNATLLSMLMNDLDEAGKPARYIDHDPLEGKRDV